MAGKLEYGADSGNATCVDASAIAPWKYLVRVLLHIPIRFSEPLPLLPLGVKRQQIVVDLG